MATFDSLTDQNTDLIRKSLGGAFFIGDASGTNAAEPITALTSYTAAVTGPPAVPEKIDLVDLAAAKYADLGYLTDDGIGFENETSQSDVSSWQSIQPTRSDMLTDTDTITVVAQETKLITLKVFTGADLQPNALAAQTGELGIAKPERPVTRFYRGLALAVDGEGDDEFFIGRYYPKLKVTGRNGQTYGKGDDPIAWGVTMTAFVDSSLGYSCKFLFGGKGWKAKAAAMGFTV